MLPRSTTAPWSVGSAGGARGGKVRHALYRRSWPVARPAKDFNLGSSTQPGLACSGRGRLCGCLARPGWFLAIAVEFVKPRQYPPVSGRASTPDLLTCVSIYRGAARIGHSGFMDPDRPVRGGHEINRGVSICPQGIVISRAQRYPRVLIVSERMSSDVPLCRSPAKRS